MFRIRLRGLNLPPYLIRILPPPRRILYLIPFTLIVNRLLQRLKGRRRPLKEILLRLQPLVRLVFLLLLLRRRLRRRRLLRVLLRLLRRLRRLLRRRRLLLRLLLFMRLYQRGLLRVRRLRLLLTLLNLLHLLRTLIRYPFPLRPLLTRYFRRPTLM